MKKLKIAVASEPTLDEYRKILIEHLSLMLDAQVSDINILSQWRNKEELVENCIEEVVSNHVDFVVLVSRTGNGLQMIANKHEKIRAAPIPRMEYVEEAASLDPNMCEISSTFFDPQSASELVVELFRLRKTIER